jgi:predicted nucleotidyltransferase
MVSTIDKRSIDPASIRLLKSWSKSAEWVVTLQRNTQSRVNSQIKNAKATCCSLTICFSSSIYPSKMKRQQIISILKDQKDLLKRYSVDRIYLFGPSAGNEAMETSDVDLIVEFSPDAHIGLFRFSRLRRELSQALNCEVHLPPLMLSTMR